MPFAMDGPEYDKLRPGLWAEYTELIKLMTEKK